MTTQCPKCKAENPDESKFCNECGLQIYSIDKMPAPPTQTLEAPREELTTGSTFAGRYQIIEELGRGGMGKVYRALDKKLNEEVALKLIKPEIASDRKTLERFQNELKLARKIRHSNVGGMYELLEDKGLHYITMEYVSGEDLKSFIRRSKQLSIPTVISITQQVCEGLSEAHKLGIVHRDLKPSNIMIDKDGNARIMDFGIARSLKGKGITGAGVMIGTPEYMSPEQVEGIDIDYRSDIYSLGVILYEMVTGKVPFDGETPLSIAHKHKYEAPREPIKVNTHIPADLNNLILKCLEKDKDKRYQSAREVRSELENIEKGIPTTEKIVPKRKPITSRKITLTFGLRRLFIPALVVTLAIITIIIWRLFPRREIASTATGKPYLAILYILNNTGDKNLDQMRINICQWMVTDLYQSKYIDVVPMDQIHSIFDRLNLAEVKGYTSEDLKKIAKESGVSHILQASLSRVSDQFRIDYSLHETKNLKTIASEFVIQSPEDPFTQLIDEITRQMKKKLNLTSQQIASDIDMDIGKVTTQDPQALHYYIEGERLHYLHQYDKAIEAFEQALRFDPEFAMAYRMIGSCYWNLGENEKYRTYLQKAVDYKDHMPAREYFLLQGDIYLLRNETLDKAIEMYKKILEIYPEDLLGHHMVAYSYSERGELDEAIKYNERLLQLGTRQKMIYSNLFWWYWAKGEYEKGRQILVDYLNNVHDDSTFHWRLACIYIIERKFDSALREYKTALALDPTGFLVKTGRYWIYYFQDEFNLIYKTIKDEWDLREELPLDMLLFTRCLFVTQGNMQKAITQVKSYIKAKDRQLNDKILAALYMDLGKLHLSIRKPELALEAFIKAISLLNISESALSGDEPLWEDESNHLRILLFWETVAYLQKGDLEGAGRLLEKIKRITPLTVMKTNKNMIYFLQGKTALEQNEYSEAIKNLGLAYSSLYLQGNSYPFRDYSSRFYNSPYPHAFYLNELALAYYNSGELEKSRDEYEKLVSLTVHRYLWGDLYAKSFYMLGKICEEQGDTAKAIEHYEKFLDLWKDADDGLPEVDDARERLAELKSENP